MSEKIGPSENELGIEKEGIDPNILTWEMLQFMETNNIGLRHTTTANIDNELENGVIGDSMSLANVSNIVPEEMVPDDIKELSKRFNTKPTIKILTRSLTDDQKREICRLAEERIGDFFDASVDMAGINDGAISSSPGPVEIAGGYNSAFLIIEYEGNWVASRDREDKRLGGFGKVGKRNISPNEIIGKITPDDYISEQVSDLVNRNNIERVSAISSSDEAVYLIKKALVEKLALEISNKL